MKQSWNRLNQSLIACERCPRLREYCRKIAAEKRRAFADWNYWGRPVPNFGDPKAKMLIIGLAPAAHGANRTGRMFTGDRSGEWLYRALFKAGFANQPECSSPDDGLRLIDCAITAAAHCALPDNKPTPQELANCQSWLDQTVDLLEPRILLALGQIAFRAAVAQARRKNWYTRADAKIRPWCAKVQDWLTVVWLLASYHPSQQNTFTGKLTEPMFDGVFKTARRVIDTERAKCGSCCAEPPMPLLRPCANGMFDRSIRSPPFAVNKALRYSGAASFGTICTLPSTNAAMKFPFRSPPNPAAGSFASGS